MSNPTIEEMEKKVLDLSTKQKQVEEEIERLVKLREQIIEDLELAQLIYMYQFNKGQRFN
jgi:hypothetical protein